MEDTGILRQVRELKRMFFLCDLVDLWTSLCNAGDNDIVRKCKSQYKSKNICIVSVFKSYLSYRVGQLDKYTGYHALLLVF